LNFVTLAAGLAIAFVAVLFLRKSMRPEVASGKLKAMRDMWGPRRGLWIYRVAYVGIPAVASLVLAVAGVAGLSLSQLLAT
jgi:hypothetical protein